VLEANTWQTLWQTPNAAKDEVLNLRGQSWHLSNQTIAKFVRAGLALIFLSRKPSYIVCACV
jgi:hypothetical protein